MMRVTRREKEELTYRTRGYSARSNSNSLVDACQDQDVAVNRFKRLNEFGRVGPSLGQSSICTDAQTTQMPDMFIDRSISSAECGQDTVRLRTHMDRDMEKGRKRSAQRRLTPRAPPLFRLSIFGPQSQRQLSASTSRTLLCSSPSAPAIDLI